MDDYLSVTMNPKEHKRIFSKVSIDNTTKCWNWIGSLDTQGYGLLWYRGRTERIHRVIYAFFIKPIPRREKRKDAQLDHLCRNTSCCNPEHLELVPQRINGLRGNGPQAVNARKTHCKYGHQLTETPSGRRDCKTCDSIRKKERLIGPNREYWLKLARQNAKRYYDRHLKKK